jgi:hypothetical protein
MEHIKLWEPKLYTTKLNKYLKKIVLVFTRIMSGLLAKSCSGDQKTECIAERETEERCDI